MTIAVNKQINAELWSSYLYLAMSLDAQQKNLNGLAHWFFVQWREEQDHARILQHYLASRNATVVLYPINGVPPNWVDASHMFKDTLNHEKEVTKMINKLMNIAIEESDYATISRLLWFVDEQVEEEETASELYKKFSAANDFLTTHSLESELSHREYHCAPPLCEYE